MIKQRECINPGTKLKDNEPHMTNRILIVEEVSDRFVFCRNTLPSFPKVRIDKNRIFTDGKPRRSGFSVVEEKMKRKIINKKDIVENITLVVGIFGTILVCVYLFAVQFSKFGWWMP